MLRAPVSTCRGPRIMSRVPRAKVRAPRAESRTPRGLLGRFSAQGPSSTTSHPPFRGWHLVRLRGLVGDALFSFGSFVWPCARRRMATPQGPRTTALTPRARCAARGPNARGPGGRVPCSWPTRHGPRNLILGRGGGSREPRTVDRGPCIKTHVSGCRVRPLASLGHRPEYRVPSTEDRGPWTTVPRLIVWMRSHGGPRGVSDHGQRGWDLGSRTSDLGSRYLVPPLDRSGI
jgi:hypothetical protein